MQVHSLFTLQNWHLRRKTFYFNINRQLETLVGQIIFIVVLSLLLKPDNQEHSPITFGLDLNAVKFCEGKACQSPKTNI